MEKLLHCALAGALIGIICGSLGMHFQVNIFLLYIFGTVCSVLTTVGLFVWGKE